MWIIMLLFIKWFFISHYLSPWVQVFLLKENCLIVKFQSLRHTASRYPHNQLLLLFLRAYVWCPAHCCHFRVLESVLTFEWLEDREPNTFGLWATHHNWRATGSILPKTLESLGHRELQEWLKAIFSGCFPLLHCNRSKRGVQINPVMSI